MRIGIPKLINWKEYRTPHFRFAQEMMSAECGAYALYTLTKLPYEKIIKMSRKGHWPNSMMFSFLKKRGFEIIPVTLGNVVEAHSVKRGKPDINTMNVLLINQHCYKEESTWSVIYNNNIAHSGDIDSFDSMEFINYPIAEAYLIFHKSWK